VLVDSHCHIDLILKESPDDSAEAIVARAKLNDVGFLLNVSVSLNQFKDVLAIAEKFPHVAASLGVHPNESPENELDLATLLRLGQHKKVIAIGETGLDYYRSQGDLTWQRQRFKMHIEASKQLQKPLIIHTRAAKEDTLKIMQEENVQDTQGVMHCFSEDLAAAEVAMDLGFYISFSGVVTFKNAQVLQEVARVMPLERMLVETDSPYLAPMPHRGKRNEPAYVKHTAEFIAKLRGISYETLAEQTTQNFFTLFKGATRPHV
jgi:TatD DNase family protein